MGFLTPIMFHNDALHAFKKDPEQVMEIISKACREHKAKSYGFTTYDKPKWWQFWKKKMFRSSYANYIKSLGTAHADVNRVVVITGNSWVDLTSSTYQEEVNLDYIEKCLKIAQSQITQIKREVKTLREQEKDK